MNIERMVETGRRRDVFSIASEPLLPADLEIAYLNSPLQFALHRRRRPRNGRRHFHFNSQHARTIRLPDSRDEGCLTVPPCQSVGRNRRRRRDGMGRGS